MKFDGDFAPRAVVGVSAVALLVFGTRWASYLGMPPLFVTDVLLTLGVAHYSFSRLARPAPAQDYLRPRVALLVAVFLWALARFVAGWHFDLVAIRDAAPYLYAAVGIVAGSAVARAPQEARERTTRLLVWALGLHAAWVGAVTVVPALPTLFPMVEPAQGLHYFSLRSDVDTALNGVFAGWLLTVVMRSERVFWPLIAFLATWVVILQSQSRAGLGAALLATGLAFVAAQSSRAARGDRRALALALTPLILGAAALALPQMNIGERVAGTFGSSQSELARFGAGTTQARTAAWEAVWQYVQEDPARYVVGVGFGPDLMNDSYAGFALVGSTLETGTTVPRSPHNYWVGTFGRLGIVGLALSVLLAGAVLLRAWRQAWHPAVDDRLGFLAGLLAVSLLPVATLGVVLESPFGAVPYFWAAGVLFAYPTAASRSRPVDPDRSQVIQSA